jgi:hypothetical protein
LVCCTYKIWQPCAHLEKVLSIFELRDQVGEEKICFAESWRSRKVGVDVMITFFCDFRQFSAKKMAFFLETNVMMKSLQKLTVYILHKNAN